MVTFTDLYAEVRNFCRKYEEKVPAENAVAMKEDLLKLVQKAIEHGEGKDQSKITGILTSVVGMFLGKKG